MTDINDSKQFREKIRILERKLGILEDSEFSCCGITLAQCHALVEIGRTENISLNRLAEVLDLENSTMCRTVNNLVVSGHVKRDADPQDRRYVTIVLTDDGRRMFESVESAMNSYYSEIFEQIPEDKREQVMESLDLIVGAADKSNCCGENSCCEK